MVNERRLKQARLDGQGLHVLPSQQNNGLLATAYDLEAVVEGHYPEIAGREPTLLKDRSCLLGILVVALHHLGPLGLDLTPETPTEIATRGIRIQDDARRRIDDS